MRNTTSVAPVLSVREIDYSAPGAGMPGAIGKQPRRATAPACSAWPSPHPLRPLSLHSMPSAFACAFESTCRQRTSCVAPICRRDPLYRWTALELKADLIKEPRLRRSCLLCFQEPCQGCASRFSGEHKPVHQVPLLFLLQRSAGCIEQGQLPIPSVCQCLRRARAATPRKYETPPI